MLSIRNVSKTYKKSTVKAIDDVSIEIEDGDIYGFIGPNGAGNLQQLNVLLVSMATIVVKSI